ncbi:hypothetical protein DFH09DRAFT_1203220 [Mycena vulgaris]|nr:hypothetical protein DFH09DRAFT_1203220 [Mycena vulgaris]
MKAPARPCPFVLLLKPILAGCEAVAVAGWEACAWRSLSRSRRLGRAPCICCPKSRWRGCSRRCWRAFEMGSTVRCLPRTDAVALAHLFGFTHARRHQERHAPPQAQATPHPRQENPRSYSPPASPSRTRHALVVLKNFSTARKQVRRPSPSHMFPSTNIAGKKGTTSPLACAPPPDDSTLEETRGRNAVDKDIQRMPSGPRTAAIERVARRAARRQRRARCSPPRPPRR